MKECLSVRKRRDLFVCGEDPTLARKMLLLISIALPTVQSPCCNVGFAPKQVHRRQTRATKRVP